MWPKMLLEFLPHLTRLIPAAENFLNSRKETEKAQAAAFAAFADEVRAGLAKTAEDQAAFRREFQAHVASVAQRSAEASRLQATVDSLEPRLGIVEKRLKAVWALLWANLVVVAVVLVLSVVRLVR